MESFYGRLRGQAENCSQGDEETTLIRDNFILINLDSNAQKELVKETVSPTKALETANLIDMNQNQQKIKQILARVLNQRTLSINFKAAVAPQTTNNNGKTYLATQPSLKTIDILVHVQHCKMWSNMEQLTPSNITRKNREMQQLRKFRPLCQEVQNITTDRHNRYQKRWWGFCLLYIYLSTTIRTSKWLNYDSDCNDYLTAISSDAEYQLEPLSAKDQQGKIVANSMIHSGSVCSIITKTLFNIILNKTLRARWIASKCERDLKTLLNEPIKLLGKITTTVVYNDWINEDACLKL